MASKYYPPLFLTGNLPNRDPSQIISLMLCLKRLNIKLPKDIYKLIYEELHILTLDRFELHNILIHPLTLYTESDFVVIRPKAAGTIDFSYGISYRVSEGKTYLLCPRLLSGGLTRVNCEKVSVEYWSFVDPTSSLCLTFYGLSHALNSDIDGSTLMYVSGTVFHLRDKLIRSTRDLYPMVQAYIDVCLKHGLIRLDDPLSRQVTGYINEQGKGIGV